MGFSENLSCFQGWMQRRTGCTDEKIHERRWSPNGRKEDIGRGDARCTCPGECRGHRASLAWLWHEVQAGMVKKLGLDGPTDLWAVPFRSYTSFGLCILLNLGARSSVLSTIKWGEEEYVPTGLFADSLKQCMSCT